MSTAAASGGGIIGSGMSCRGTMRLEMEMVISLRLIPKRKRIAKNGGNTFDKEGL